MAHSNTGDDLSLALRMKQMTWPQRISYLWYYYKWIVLAVLAGAVLLGWFLHDVIAGQNARSLVSVTLVNALPGQDSDLFERFPPLFGCEEGESVYVDNTLHVDLEARDARSAQSFQVLAAQFTVGEIDLFICGTELFERMAQNGGFLPLEELCPEGIPGEWKERLLWRTDPDSGRREAVGVLLNPDALVEGGWYPAGETLAAGVCAMAQHTDAAAQLLRYLDGLELTETAE